MESKGLSPRPPRIDYCGYSLHALRSIFGLGRGQRAPTAGVNAAGSAMDASENQAMPHAITLLPARIPRCRHFKYQRNAYKSLYGSLKKTICLTIC